METRTDIQPVKLIAYWIVVGVPLIWGVAQTIHKAAALFN